jgi:hypothetical protein
MNLQTESHTSTQGESSATVCPCWRSGSYVWNDRCPSHLVKDPFHFSLDELQHLVELVKSAESLDNVWPIIDRLRAARD